MYTPEYMLGTLKTIFHSQKTFHSVGGSLSWSETPYFHKGGPLQMAPKCKKKLFSNSYTSRTKWPRHQKWALNWRFLRELNCEPIFEQVTPSRSSGKNRKSLGAKYAGRLSTFLEYFLGKFIWVKSFEHFEGLGRGRVIWKD